MIEKDTIRENLDKMQTDELLNIWNDNNRVEWRDEAFEEIEDILNERNVPMPVQNPHDPSMDIVEKKELKIVGGVSIGGAVAYAIGNGLAEAFPDSELATFIAGAIIGCFMGALFGLIPYYIAKPDNTKWAKAYLITCALVGMLLGLVIAAPLAILFAGVAYIRRKRSKVKSDDDSRKNETNL